MATTITATCAILEGGISILALAGLVLFIGVIFEAIRQSDICAGVRRKI